MSDQVRIIMIVAISIVVVTFNILSLKREFILKYFLFLFRPWKITFFILAISGLSTLSFFANDPTWDVGVSLLMGTLTFIFSTYTIFGFYNFLQTKKISIHFFNSIFFFFLSAGWSYDFYNYFKIGHIPNSWSENLILSSFVYVLAGFFWNVEERNNCTVLSITLRDWPNPNNRIGAKTIVKFIVPISLFVSIFFLSFLTFA